MKTLNEIIFEETKLNQNWSYKTSIKIRNRKPELKLELEKL